MKARRQKQRVAQRRGILIAIVGIVVILIAIIVGATVYENTRPIGEINTAETHTYPAVDGRSLGDPNAPVKIEVFEDFQCPACRSFSSDGEVRIITEMKDLIESGKVFYQYRHFPFIDDRSAARESDKAANASMCAAEQGKFWEMKSTIFANWDGENQGSFTDRRLVAMAETVDLDMAQFNNCFDDSKYQSDIDVDYDAGRKLGVTGTPTVFVNGEILSPGFVPSYDEIKAKVDAVLSTSQ
jgi:protein-disulfide isomerase